MVHGHAGTVTLNILGKSFPSNMLCATLSVIRLDPSMLYPQHKHCTEHGQGYATTSFGTLRTPDEKPMQHIEVQGS